MFQYYSMVSYAPLLLPVHTNNNFRRRSGRGDISYRKYQPLKPDADTLGEADSCHGGGGGGRGGGGAGSGDSSSNGQYNAEQVHECVSFR